MARGDSWGHINNKKNRPENQGITIDHNLAKLIKIMILPDGN
jgi:hypothetical protein